MPSGFVIKSGLYVPSTLAGWVGFDLDGTLALHASGDSIETVGKPVERMVQRLKSYIARGQRCKIMTARVASMNPDRRRQAKVVQDWLERQGVPRLEVTAEKDYLMIYLYDDRARQVIPNTGVVVGEE